MQSKIPPSAPKWVLVLGVIAIIVTGVMTENIKHKNMLNSVPREDRERVREGLKQGKSIDQIDREKTEELAKKINSPDLSTPKPKPVIVFPEPSEKVIPKTTKLPSAR